MTRFVKFKLHEPTNKAGIDHAYVNPDKVVIVTPHPFVPGCAHISFGTSHGNEMWVEGTSEQIVIMLSVY